jgi:hypothetical protein
LGRREAKIKAVGNNRAQAQVMAKYVGSDEFDLLILFPNGFAWEVRYNIKVR